MKQIVDKLNKIAKAIDENVELSDRDLIIDSLDSITKAFGGTPNESNLIVDKLEDIAGVVHGGGGGGLTVPHLIMNITNIGQFPARWGAFSLPMESIYIENDYLYISINDPNSTIGAGERKIVDVLYARFENDGVVTFRTETPIDATTKNLVNCTIENDPFPTIVITDPTQNASIDVEVEGTR